MSGRVSVTVESKFYALANASYQMNACIERGFIYQTQDFKTESTPAKLTKIYVMPSTANSIIEMVR